ncbi:MAG: N-acetylneuraminate synthase family protein [bacterium]|nr:N-acetylneuraminate synthase family protein [bacterium]MDZ4295803.1 N-acetylneuraminate synthase family protein [Patescibacteria group bacterium]
MFTFPWEQADRAGRAGVFVIAEVGKNFIQTQEERPVAEYLENARALVRAAKEAGADAVKFQTHHVEDEQLNIPVVSPHFKGADRYSWVTRNTNATPLDEFWRPLKAFCDELGILFFSTPMSRGAAEKLSALGPQLWKVGSGDILDFVTLDYLAKTGRPIVLSSGMSTLEELDKSIDFLQRRNAPVVLLHCVSKYPCPPEELHLSTIGFLRERYGIPVGFSDHSIGIDSALAAVALGAVVVEKHFSFARDLWGADHKVSMTPEELRALVQGIRALESRPELRAAYLTKDIVTAGMGTGGKVLQPDEAVFRPYFRKALMAGCDIAADTVLEPHMLYAMRPHAYAGGLPSEQYERVLGKRTARALKKYEPITWEKLA